jgi:signal transduction histidine kinase
MIELSRSEEGIFHREFFLIEKVLKDSLIDVLEMTDPSFVERLYPLSNQRDIQEVLHSRGIYTEVKGKYCASPFCHDSKKIRQILRNLIGNAVKYRRNRVQVSIEGEEDLLIRIEDDGYGIPKEAEEAIFRRFIRLKDKRRGEQPGIGLGLPGVKTLVEAMRGDISMKSQEGAGTCFMVRIPSFKP